MKRLLILTMLWTALAVPATAQDADNNPSLMEEGARLFLRGLMGEMEPAIEDLRDLMEDAGPALQQFADEMGPALAEMLSRLDDIRHYEQPEFLPNGDIIIRRKPDAPPFDAGPPDDGGAIDL